MALRLLTPPEGMPLTLAETKLHLRVDHSADDSYISALIAAAVSRTDGKDGFLQRAIMTQQWRLILDAFPPGEILIPLPPLQTIDEVRYFDAASAEQPFDYVVDMDSAPARMWPAGAWPTGLQSPMGVEIDFTAGYAEVPAAIKHGLLLLIGAWYENREQAVIGTIVQPLPITMGADALLSPYIVLNA